MSSARRKDADADVLVSVVTTAFNEESNLRELYRRLRHTFEAGGGNFELLIVDGGSRDDALDLLRSLHKEDARVAGHA